MYIIDQDIANEIAKSQTMKYREMLEMFRAIEDQAVEMESLLRREIFKLTNDDQVARAVVAYLPLLLEHKAITNYIDQTKNSQLRMMMPEILTADEAGLMAQREYLLDNVQLQHTINQIKKYQEILNADLLS